MVFQRQKRGSIGKFGLFSGFKRRHFLEIAIKHLSRQICSIDGQNASSKPCDEGLELIGEISSGYSFGIHAFNLSVDRSEILPCVPLQTRNRRVQLLNSLSHWIHSVCVDFPLDNFSLLDSQPRGPLKRQCSQRTLRKLEAQALNDVRINRKESDCLFF